MFFLFFVCLFDFGNLYKEFYVLRSLKNDSYSKEKTHDIEISAYFFQQKFFPKSFRRGSGKLLGIPLLTKENSCTVFQSD